MAKKKPAKRKSKSADLYVHYGDETFQVKKSATYFAVKKRVGAECGVLESARDNADGFQQLALNAENSTRDIEVYAVASDSLDTAMDALREHGNDVEWCGHVYHTPGDPQGLMIPKDSLYIELEADADPDAVNKLLTKHALEVVSQDPDNSNSVVLRLTSASTDNPIKIANKLLASDQIKAAEPDFATSISYKLHRPSDSLFVDQWHLENRGGIGLTAGADVSAPGAWEITRGSRSVLVCIMDDGVDIDHVDFSSPGKIVAPRDFGQDDTDPSPVRNGRGRNGDNHGTACAGVAVADENGVGVVGIASNCGLMPIRTSGMISNDTIKDLFDHARLSGADVISCSWGVSRKFFPLSTPMKNSIAKAAREGRGGKGCVILFAAGNENSPVDGKNGFGERVLAGFAKHADVMAIAASNSHDRRSHYSNFGPEIWVAAPSSGSGGRGILTTDRSGNVGYETGDYTINDPFGGTSSSTPLVAGICGLILSVNPNLTAEEVRDILKETSDRIDPAGGNYNAQNHSDLYGFGRVNAEAAVLEARRRLAPISVRTRVFERTPAIAIPDNHPVGISDTISVGESAMVTSVGVSVEIRHTYRGDLQVLLIGPDGTSVMLHNRRGGGRDNLVQSYDANNTPGLSQLVDRLARGNWTLQVRDRARVDIGMLDRWSLSLDLAGTPQTEWETSPGLEIPDNDRRGVVSELEVDGVGELQDIEVTVDITHTYRGDLRVELVTPDGRSVSVHNRKGGGQDHLQRTFRVGDLPALQAIVNNGVEINGTWELRVADHANIDLGKLNSWKLKLIT